MLQIRITSLTSQNGPLSLQGSDRFHWRGSELFLIRLGMGHSMVPEWSELLWIPWRPCFPHVYSSNAAIFVQSSVLQPLSRCIYPPKLKKRKHSKSERGSDALPCAAAIEGWVHPREGILYAAHCQLSLPFKAVTTRVLLSLIIWKASVQFGNHLELDCVHCRPAASSGTDCSHCKREWLGRRLPSLVLKLKGC